MPRMVGFIGSTYSLRSVNVDCQRTINLYPEVNETGLGKEREVAALIGTPGLRRLFTFASVVRCMYAASNGTLFAVAGGSVYKITGSNSTKIADILTSIGIVDMSDNGKVLVIVDGANLYSIPLMGGSLTVVKNEGWRGSYSVDFVDGYFVFVQPQSGVFYISGLYSTDLDALDFASSEGLPDNIVASIVDHRELWMLGEKSTEIFFNSGNADFPFDRVQGAFLEIGCAAPKSVQKLNNSVIWLAKSDSGHGYVVAAQGYQPQRISNHAVEQAIQSYGDLSDAVAYTYQQDGHAFYVLNFTSANTTWVYDMLTGMWHERSYLNNGRFERHRGQCCAFFNGAHYVSDYDNGNVYSLELDCYTDNGVPIKRVRTAPHSTQDLNRIFYNEVQIDMETGVGLDGAVHGSDPIMVLDWSDDGGHSWSNEKQCAMGKIGQYKARARWFRLGQAWDRVFRISITDPVKVVLIGATYEASMGGR